MNILSINKKLHATDIKIAVISYRSPLGEMFLGATDQGVCFIEFHDRIKLEQVLLKLAKILNAFFVYEENKHLIKLKNELKLYFEKKLKKFTIPLVLTGTEFQQKVFQSLIQIPYGNTSTYKNQAIILGNVKAIRAVATANSLNKLAIVVPCHRIIGSSGLLVGYAGGIFRKKALLQLEEAVQQTQLELII